MRPHERVADALRARVRTGVWQEGQMIPGRRRLAEEHGVALTTVERAVAALISEGVLRADDRRGTFVATPAATPTASGVPGSAVHGAPLVATVGLIAGIIPYPTRAQWAAQWPAQILAACEHCLSAEAGLDQRFVNLIPAPGADLAPALAVAQLQEQGVDAAVIIGIGGPELEALAAHATFPLVAANYDPVDTLVPQVFIDNSAGGVLAARHLRSRGFRPLTYLRPFAASWVDARLAGARAEAGDDELRVFPKAAPKKEPGLDAEGQRDTAARLGRSLLKAGFAAGTGVIAPNDSVAQGFQDAAAERGLEAGRDYGLVGFDDRTREAQLTSLRPPLAQLGEEAARMVLTSLRGGGCPTRVALPPRLIARTSSRFWDGAAQPGPDPDAPPPAVP